MSTPLDTLRGEVILSVKDPTAQDLLWEYAQRRREVDAEFSDDLEQALRNAGYVPTTRARWRTISKPGAAIEAFMLVEDDDPHCLGSPDQPHGSRSGSG